LLGLFDPEDGSKTYSSETSVDFQWKAWRYIAEDRTLHDHHCENLKSYIINDLQGTMQKKNTLCPKQLPFCHIALDIIK
jgi:hypothetical protein